jgi:TonB family protein
MASEIRLMRNKVGVPVAVFSLLAAALLAQGDFSPVQLLSARLWDIPFGVQSGGIAAFRVSVDETGAVTGLESIQEFAPYGDLMRQKLPEWQFEPARENGQAVASHVLVLGLFRPPMIQFAMPEAPRYKDTQAPDDVPWPTSAEVPVYPPEATGSGMSLLQVDVSRDGTVTGTRVVGGSSPFDAVAAQGLRNWKFRPALRQNRQAASRFYAVILFIGEIPPIG